MAKFANEGHDIHQVYGRRRAKGEVNGKAENLNYCLKSVIYRPHLEEAELRAARATLGELQVRRTP